MIDQPVVFPDGRDLQVSLYRLALFTTALLMPYIDRFILVHICTKSSMSSVPRNLFWRRFWVFSITQRTGRHESMSAGRRVANEAKTVSIRYPLAFTWILQPFQLQRVESNNTQDASETCGANNIWRRNTYHANYHGRNLYKCTVCCMHHSNSEQYHRMSQHVT